MQWAHWSAAWRGEAERWVPGEASPPPRPIRCGCDRPMQFLSLLPRCLPPLHPAPRFSRLLPLLPPRSRRGVWAPLQGKRTSWDRGFEAREPASVIPNVVCKRDGIQKAVESWVPYGLGGALTAGPKPGSPPPPLPGASLGTALVPPRPSTPRLVTPSLRGCARVYSRRGSPGECDSEGQSFPAPRSRGVPGRLEAQSGAPATRPLGRMREGMRELPRRSKKSFWLLPGWFGAVRNSGWPAFSGPSQHPHPHPEDGARANGQAGPGTVTTGARPWAGERTGEPRGRAGRRASHRLLPLGEGCGRRGAGAPAPLEPRPAGVSALLEPCWGRQLPSARLLDMGSDQVPHPCSPHETPKKYILYNIPMTFRGELESIWRVEMGPGGGK